MRSGIIWSPAANAGIGNNILARDHAGQAVNMEPNNMQYRQLLNQIESTGQRYQNSPLQRRIWHRRKAERKRKYVL